MYFPKVVLRAAARVALPGGADARLAILMYHRVLKERDPYLWDVLDARAFEGQVATLVANFRVLPLAEAVERLRDRTLPARSVCITFDDGYRDNYEVALPILEAHKARAVFFIASGFLDGGRMFNDTVLESLRRFRRESIELPSLGLPAMPTSSPERRRAAADAIIARVKHLPQAEREAACERLAALADGPLPQDLMMSSDQVRGLARAGMEIGGHTLTHPILSRIDDGQARAEIEMNRAELAALTGRAVDVFAYPNGVPDQDYAVRHARMVEEVGYRAAVSTSSSVATRGSDRFQLPRFAPWDRDATRFAIRLLRDAVTAARARDATPEGGLVATVPGKQ